jgi:hypothetical protein
MKRSSRNKPMWVVVHICMEEYYESFFIAIFISNYQKCYVFLITSYVFSSTKLENKRAEQILHGSKQGEVAHIMHKHVSKCKKNINK